MSFKEELEILQKKMAEVDLFTRQKSRNGIIEFLVLKLQNLKVKMYQEKAHQLPHIHIDYGKQSHIASYSIDPTQRLDGTLHKKYDKVITEWVAQNKEGLLAIWQALQLGHDPRALLPELITNA